jgi:hypothetical protein
VNLSRTVPIAIGVALLGLLAWGVTSLLERLTERQPDPAVVTTTPPPGAETPHIAATLFYATAEGDALMAVQREVPLADGLVAQGRQILTAQFAPPPAPYVSAIPPGTTLRAFFVTEKGDAFVDVSGISTAHPGGSLTELLTVQAIVNAVTANLPAVQRVQILVDGKEVDTIAGHVDIRQPLTRDTSLIRAQDADAP